MLMKYLTTKVLGGALAGSLILSGFLGLQLAFTKRELSSAKEVIQSLEGWQGDMVTAIRLASGNAKVDKTTALPQLQALGQAHAELKSLNNTQNKAIEALEAETKQAQLTAERAAKAKAAAIAKAENLQEELLTRVPREDVEKAVREVQDKLYEAGL